jgi:hypothetical protein
MWLNIVLLTINSDTDTSTRPNSSNGGQNIVNQHLAVNFLGYVDRLSDHCACWAILATMLYKLNKWLQPNLVVETLFAILVVPRPSYSSHEHDLLNEALAFVSS